MNALGIDFGTTKTLVAAWKESVGRAETVRLGRSGDEIPTTIHVDPSKQFLFGEDADDQIAVDPAAYVRRVKRDLGKGRPPRQLNGHSFTTIELIQAFLSEIKRRVEVEYFDAPIDHVVITVPAKYGPAARHDLKTAATNAGFKSVDLLDEPVAAGVAFLEDKKESNIDGEILVFDWGGGTLDIALVEFQNGVWTIDQNLIDGDAELGGEDIDEDLIDAINGILVDRGQRAIVKQNTTDYPLLYKRVIETKRLLSQKESHSFHFRTSNYDFPFKITRSEFEGFISDKLNKAINCLRAWEDRAVRAGKNPSHVLLVGGTSKIPAVAEAISLLERKPRQWDRGRDAVALGAAIHASKKDSVNYHNSGDVKKLSLADKEFVTQLAVRSGSIIEKLTENDLFELLNKHSDALENIVSRANGFNENTPNEDWVSYATNVIAIAQYDGIISEMEVIFSKYSQQVINAYNDDIEVIFNKKPKEIKNKYILGISKEEQLLSFVFAEKLTPVAEEIQLLKEKRGMLHNKFEAYKEAMNDEVDWGHVGGNFIGGALAVVHPFIGIPALILNHKRGEEKKKQQGAILSEYHQSLSEYVKTLQHLFVSINNFIREISYSVSKKLIELKNGQILVVLSHVEKQGDSCSNYIKHLKTQESQVEAIEAKLNIK